MILDPLHPELVRLDQIYQQTCASFENGELSAGEARERILNLSYTDSQGRTWRIDTKRSGHRVAFTDEISDQVRQSTKRIHDIPNSAATPLASAELIRLDQIYQQTCASFENGELSAEEARERILNLSYTDSQGRTWRIDTKRSGRRAKFTDEIENHVVQPTKFILEIPPSTTLTLASITHIATSHAVSPIRHDDYQIPDTRDQQTTSRRIRTQIVAKAAGAIIMLVAIVVILINDDSPAATVPVVPISVTTTAALVAPQFANIASFSTRQDVPFDVDIEFGRSVHDVPLLVHRRGVPDGVSVLVIGVIHGDEDAGLAVLDELRKIELDTKIDLWLVPTMNPDGQVGEKTRQNANGVDLNRNFPARWKANELPGNWQYAGPSAGSEPEVQAMVRLGNLIKPQIVIWYHQDYFRISPSTGREGAIRERYAALVELPLLVIAGGTYNGTGSIWSKSLQGPNDLSLTVEFGPSPLRPGEAIRNASAIPTIVREFFQDS
ncbi:MAG: M14 family metallopeptidase [Ilumatobacteraceae bacterium]